MQLLTMCWIFDKRWMFSLPNPCLQFLMTLPIVLNALSLIAMQLERGLIGKDAVSGGTWVMVGWGVLLVVELGWMLWVYGVAEDKLRSSGDTVGHYRLRTFLHSFEAKQKVWGWMGLLLTFLTIAQMIVNAVFLGRNSPCLINKIRLGIDLASVGYILVVMLIFLFSKVGFLAMAWTQPEKYLNFKGII